MELLMVQARKALRYTEITSMTCEPSPEAYHCQTSSYDLRVEKCNLEYKPNDAANCER